MHSEAPGDAVAGDHRECSYQKSGFHADLARLRSGEKIDASFRQHQR
jgi:hypothetical protein